MVPRRSDYLIFWFIYESVVPWLEQCVVRSSASERRRCPPLSDDRNRTEGDTVMTTIRFEQDHGVGTIVLANPPQNRIGSQLAVDLRVAVHEASLSDSRVLV